MPLHQLLGEFVSGFLSSQFSEGCESAAPQDPLKSQNTLFFPRGYWKLQAVTEQLILFETLKQNFEDSLINHITNIFELQVGSTAHGSSKSWEIGIFWGSWASGAGDATVTGFPKIVSPKRSSHSPSPCHCPSALGLIFQGCRRNPCSKIPLVTFLKPLGLEIFCLGFLILFWGLLICLQSKIPGESPVL